MLLKADLPSVYNPQAGSVGVQNGLTDVQWPAMHYRMPLHCSWVVQLVGALLCSQQRAVFNAGEHGQWQLAEKLFAELEVEALRDLGPSGQAPSSAASQASLDALPLQLVFSAGGAPLPPAPGGIWGAEQPPRWDDASPPSAEGLPIRGMKLGSSVGSDAGSDILSSGSFGEMPKALAEQVLDEELLDAQAPELHCPQDPLGLPDCIPGQSNLGSPHSHSSVASSRQGLRLGRDASQASSDAASTSGSGSSTDGSHDRAARPWLPAPGLVRPLAGPLAPPALCWRWLAWPALAVASSHSLHCIILRAASMIWHVCVTSLQVRVSVACRKVGCCYIHAVRRSLSQAVHLMCVLLLHANVPRV